MPQPPNSTIRPWPKAVLAQLLALATMALVVIGLAHQGLRLPLLSAAMMQGLLAALGAWRLGLPRWWCVINLLFVPALVLASQAQLPAWLYLLAFASLVLVNLNSFTEQVPLYLSGRKSCQALDQWLHENESVQHFIDLGCGTGHVLLELARSHPRRHFTGVETAPLLFALAWLRALFQENCQIRYRSLWRTDLSQYDAAYCFLSPVPMPRLWQQAQAQMRPGSWLISNTFEVPDVTPDQVIEINQGRQTCLRLWQVIG